MTACLADDDLTHSLMHRAWLSLLRLDPQAAPALELLTAPDWTAFHALATAERLAAVQDHALLTGGLRRFLVADPSLERGLTFTRRWFFEQRGATIAARFLPLLCTLARYCFFSEYVLDEREDPGLLPARAATAADVALLGCYRALADDAGAAGFGALSPDPLYRDLLRVQIDEPLAERAIAAGIPSLAPIDDAVSRAVQRQYEENPYPRWASVGGGPPVGPQVAALARGKRVLVAGCGTGLEAADAALMFPEARVDAVDLSRASLAYAARQARARGIENLRLWQADLLDVARLPETYDLVVASGVLHHMADPAAGLRALLGVLRPRGLLKIALYSTRARAAFTEARAWARQQGYAPTPAGIRAFRAAVLARADGDPLRQRLTASYDFYSISACRDLAFHVQETTFTLPELAELTRALELSVVRFDPRSPAHARAYRQRFPGDRAGTDLASWDALERESPQMFSGMYVLWLARRAEQAQAAEAEWIRATGRM